MTALDARRLAALRALWPGLEWELHDSGAYRTFSRGDVLRVVVALMGGMWAATPIYLGGLYISARDAYGRTPTEAARKLRTHCEQLSRDLIEALALTTGHAQKAD